MEDDQPRKKPTKPITAYFTFMQDHVDEYKDLTPKERTRALGRRWKELDEETRQVYVDAYEKRAQLYKKDMEKWLEEHPNDQPTSHKFKLSKQDSEVRERRGQTAEGADTSSQRDSEPNLSADVSTNLKIFFIVGYILKYAEKNGGRTLPNDKRVRTLLSNRYDKLSESERAAWAEAWEELDKSKRMELLSFYTDLLSNADA